MTQRREPQGGTWEMETQLPAGLPFGPGHKPTSGLDSASSGVVEVSGGSTTASPSEGSTVGTDTGKPEMLRYLLTCHMQTP